MTGPIFDTHAHYSSRAFDADRFALLDSLPDKGVVGVCEQATHSGDAPRVLELAHRYPWVVAAIGIHPESLLPAADCGEDGPAPTVSVYGGDWAAEMQALTPYYDDPKVVAVGECGLDYHWPVPKDAQLALFEAEIRLALELDKPIIVHDRQAHADVYALLKKYRPKGIVHCYSGSAEDAVQLAAQGLTTFPFAVVMYLFFWELEPDGTPLLGDDPTWFVFVMVFSGLMGSWVGIVFWNAMSQRLPTALAGQMIVFETIFAVIYAHVLRMQWPAWNMLVGMALLLAGVTLSLKVFQAAKAKRGEIVV